MTKNIYTKYIYKDKNIYTKIYIQSIYTKNIYTKMKKIYIQRCILGILTKLIIWTERIKKYFRRNVFVQYI